MIFVKKDKDGKELTWFHLSYVAPKPETQPAKLFFFFFFLQNDARQCFERVGINSDIFAI